MKAINLKSLIDTEALGIELQHRYLAYFGLSLNSVLSRQGIKAHEVQTLKALVEELNQKHASHLTLLLEDFFVGYQIPQIGKEFDLLRFGLKNGRRSIINIELKSQSSEQKMKEQLLKNKYYLGFLEFDLLLFSYNQSNNKLYLLEGEELVSKDISFLANALEEQDSEAIRDINALFDPANYLVSPFNSTDKFLLGEYFLTGHQKDIKEKHIIPKVLDGSQQVMAITGGAGTGKTLLIYDIAKSLKGLAKRVIIAHCGELNAGQVQLLEQGWEIIPIKYLDNVRFEHYDLVIIDEAQRLENRQFERLSRAMTHLDSFSCIFSYDKLQWLKVSERNSGIIERIESQASYKVELSNKIRTNPEISSFIKRLLNRTIPQSHQFGNYPNIHLHYVNSPSEAKMLLLKLKEQSWQVANYREERDKALTIVGQEYDKVVAVLDEGFTYNALGTLIARGQKSHNDDYNQEQILYQILTRARKKLALIIIRNPEVLSRCLAILA